LVALIVLGPKRLPGLARALGEGIREFRTSLAEGSKPPAEKAPEQAAGAAEAGSQPVASEPVGDRLHSPDQGAAADERR
jgi:sec-independent protein translocase protein TatA